MTLTKKISWREIGNWACRWLSLTTTPEIPATPVVNAYRCRFSLDVEISIRVHVTADERYKLYLDGQLVGLGSERGEPLHWFYETYDFTLCAGTHAFVAVVWSLGDQAPHAQMSVYHGFFFAPDPPYTELLGTGIAEWDARQIEGYTFVDPSPAWGTGANLVIDGLHYPFGIESGAGDDWQKPATWDAGVSSLNDWGYDRPRVLSPALLPRMIRQPVTTARVRFVETLSDLHTLERSIDSQVHLGPEALAWQTVFNGEQPITFPPQTTRRIIIDLDNYYCAYPEIVVSGGQGSSIRLYWAEALFEDQKAHANQIYTAFPTKGNRDVIESKYFYGTGDTFLLDGSEHRSYTTLWWQAGRYLELVIQTEVDPLVIERITLLETRYPLELEAAFSSSDPRLEKLLPLLVRGVQMCAHETYLDCPYYEQLMYSGDSRIQALTTYVMTYDDRLPRKAIQMFDYSRHWFGLTQSRYPNHSPQIIGSFSLWWVGMVYDYALWRDDLAFVKRCMAGVRATIEAYLQFADVDGIITHLPGWKFLDWVPEWEAGIPPDAAQGVSAMLNWQFVWAIVIVAKLEDLNGQPLLAQHREQQAAHLAKQLDRFWSEAHGLYADDLAFSRFSEHTQILAILSEQLSPERQTQVAHNLLTYPGLSRATIHFHHYLFEAYRVIGAIEPLFQRLSLWFSLQQKGLRTLIEWPEPTRSDCHGWGSHPLYHYFATLLGIRPTNAGFSTVHIQPQLGSLTSAKGVLPHPKGEISVEYRLLDGVLASRIALPAGITGTFQYGQHVIPLQNGTQTFELKG